MNYPIWDLPLLGGGLLIGLIAIPHIFVSHFAVGGGLYLVWTERLAYRTNDDALLGYVKKHSLFFILLTLVFGAVSGVGIWWAIGLVHPSATSTLIHTFVWAWAVEWVFFFVEIAAAFFYYYGWDRLDRRAHLAFGWIYFGAAWLSLLVINGILTFMLTPGRWITTGRFIDAYFNPTMPPALVARTAVAVALAGLYALLTASRIEQPDLRRRVTRYSASWILAGCAVLPLSVAWYVALIPPLARDIWMGGAPAVTIFAGLSFLLSAMIVALAYFGPYRRPQECGIVVALVIAFLGLGVTGVTEWVREAVRKPYVIYGYMYSNAIRVDDVARLQREGILKNAGWAGVRDARLADWRAAGSDIFRSTCRSCHTIDGYNGIRPLVKGWSCELIEIELQRLNEIKRFMPPFVGTEDERRALALWLERLGGARPFSEGLLLAAGETRRDIEAAR